MNGRETSSGGLRDAPWLAVGTAVIREADATHYVDDLAVAVEPR
ncbi:hypothetical protein [Halorubrum sp. N11]